MKGYGICWTDCVTSCWVLNRLNSCVSSKLILYQHLYLAAVLAVMRAHNTHTHCCTRWFTHTQYIHTLRSSDRLSYQWLFLHITKKHRALAIKWNIWKKLSCWFLPHQHTALNQENRERVIPAICWRSWEQFVEHKALGIFLTGVEMLSSRSMQLPSCIGINALCFTTRLTQVL